ncbi:MAG: PAS domain S-box protein [Fimbriimonas sp.]|nr:PAS domain S-box protein [Fimbriimonas sp.]
MDQRALAMTESLSDRERQLVVLASKGLTDTAIAHKLGISLATVGTYWGRVRIKFGPLNRTELVAVFLQEHAASIVEALKAENQGLVQALEEKTRAEEALRGTLEFFRNLVESAPHAILLVQESGEIQLANEQAERILGYGRGELEGVNVEQIVPDRFRLDHTISRASYVENPVKRQMGGHMATYALRKDGSELPMAVSLSGAETPNGLIITCILQDLTDSLTDAAS